MARALVDRLFTIEDWLAYEGEPDTLYELVDGRFVAILLGSILGGVLIGTESGTAVVSVLLLAIAVIGYLASRQIPPISFAIVPCQTFGGFIATSRPSTSS